MCGLAKFFDNFFLPALEAGRPVDLSPAGRDWRLVGQTEGENGTDASLKRAGLAPGMGVPGHAPL